MAFGMMPWGFRVISFGLMLMHKPASVFRWGETVVYGGRKLARNWADLLGFSGLPPRSCSISPKEVSLTVLVPSVDTGWSLVLLFGELQRWDLSARDGSGGASTNKHGSILNRVEGSATILPPG
jgi:hypothetical protein